MHRSAKGAAKENALLKTFTAHLMGLKARGLLKNTV